MEEEKFVPRGRSVNQFVNQEKSVLDNMLLRMQIKKTERRIAEIQSELKHAQGEKERLEQEALKEEEDEPDKAEAQEVEQDNYSEFFNTMDQEISQIRKKFQEKRSPLYFIKSIFSSFTLIELILLFILGMLISRLVITSSEKYS